MPMPAYLVKCSRRDCEQPALFKIAARWNDGITQELKTYALSCQGCLAAHLACARVKQAACRLTAGESLEAPGIYVIARGHRDVQLARREDLESLPTSSPTDPAP